MSIENTLQELSSYSKSTASIRFKRGNDSAAETLVSRKRKCVRDATLNEIKLAAVCAGEAITET